MSSGRRDAYAPFTSKSTGMSTSVRGKLAAVLIAAPLSWWQLAAEHWDQFDRKPRRATLSTLPNMIKVKARGSRRV